MGSFSDEQFERLLAGLGQATDSEPFENYLGHLEDMPEIVDFGSFCDPTLVPMISDPESLLSFPPLPPIEEEAISPNTPPVQPSEESSPAHSIPTTVPEINPEINDALETAHWAKHLVESQRSQVEAMKLE
jgi:hypothetical protein